MHTKIDHFCTQTMFYIFTVQGSYWSWKTWKVMEFDHLDSRPGKSWNLMLANNAVYCSGLSEMYAGKHFKLWQDVNLL